MKQSIVHWCFNSAGDKWDLATTCRVAKELGYNSVELVEPEGWPIIKQFDLNCGIALNGMPDLFVRGFNNTKYHSELLRLTQERIDACSKAGVPNLIAFTGYKWRDAENARSGELPREESFHNCVEALGSLADYSAKQGVTICLEHLNSRVTTHPMKGHPGYQGDDLDWVAEIIRKVRSPGLKLLFDVYHVQIMHGDILNRIEENKDILGHVHVAGNPGRGPLDDSQEINYKSVIRKLSDIGYHGYVGHEFIPTANPYQQLQESMNICRPS